MVTSRSDYPPQSAIDKFLGATTRHTRRVEIYEPDGVTRWAKDLKPRLKSGSVSIDFDRDERRTLDLVLDNTDGVLENAPGEFWYDKIIKVFRGVIVNEPSRPPRVLVMADAVGGASMAAALRALLVNAGYGDISVNTTAAAYADTVPYDIIVGLSNATGPQITAMVSAYRAGKSVLVFDSAAVSWVASAVTGTTNSVLPPNTISPATNSSHPVAQGWAPFSLMGPVVAADTFARIVAAGWGNADVGGTYTNAWSAGGATSDFSTNGTYGEHLITVAAAIARESRLAVSVTDFDATFDVQCNQVPAQRMDVSLLGRFVDTNNNYLALCQFTTAGNIDVSLSRRNGGTVTTMVSQAAVVTGFSPTGWYRVRFRIIGSSIKMKIWAVGATEPAAWNLSTTDSSITSAGGIAFRTIPAATTTVAGLAIRFDNLSVTNEVNTGGDTTVYGYSGVTSDQVTSISQAVVDTTKSRIAALVDPGSSGRAVVVSLGINNTLFGVQGFRDMVVSSIGWLNTVQPIDAWETQIGEFMIDRISEPNFPHEMKITGRDYTKKCLTSKFAVATQFDGVATPYKLEDLISSIASNAGVHKKQLPVTGILITTKILFDRGTTRWEAMKQLANAYNYDLYFNGQGYLVMTLFSDPSLDAPPFYIETGSEGTLVSFEKQTSDTRLYNYVVVTGESSDSTVLPVFAIAENTDPLSPTNTDEIGTRVYEYTSSFIYTTQQAQDTADKFLAIHSLEEFSLSFENLVLPWLEVGSTLGFIDPNPSPGDPTSFLLTSLTLPLGLGPMSGEARRLTIIG